MNIKIKYFDSKKKFTHEEEIPVDNMSDKILSKIKEKAEKNSKDGDVFYRIHNTENFHSVMFNL